MQSILFGLLVVTILAAAAAAWLARRLSREVGVPVRARITYEDTGAWEQVAAPLYSPRHMLTGKPDYVVQIGQARIPIEVKPNRLAAEPYLSDALQLAAYGLLVEETFGVPAPYGVLKYRTHLFRVDFTREMRSQLLSVLEELRRDLVAEDVTRSHSDAPRCVACGYVAACGQELTPNESHRSSPPVHGDPHAVDRSRLV